MSILCGHVIKPDYSAALVEQSSHSLSQRHYTACVLNLYWWFYMFSQFVQNLKDNGMVGDRISAEVPPCYWRYSASRTDHHTETFLLTSDTLRFNCFVFQSSNSTLFNINTVAYKLIWPYLIKIDSWVYPSVFNPPPDKLALKACSHGDCKDLKLFNEGYIYIYLISAID